MAKAPLVVVVLVAMLCAEQASGQAWQALLPQVAGKLLSLWSSGTVNFLDRSCDVSQRPAFYRWQLYWKNTFVCPGIGNVQGYCKIRSKSKGKTCAIEDFLKKAIAGGYVTEAQASSWLGKQKG